MGTAQVEPNKASQFSSFPNILNLKTGIVAMLPIGLWFVHAAQYFGIVENGSIIPIITAKVRTLPKCCN